MDEKDDMLGLSASLVIAAAVMLALRWTTGRGGQVLTGLAVALAVCALVLLQVAQQRSRRSRRVDDGLVSKP